MKGNELCPFLDSIKIEPTNFTYDVRNKERLSSSQQNTRRECLK